MYTSEHKICTVLRLEKLLGKEKQTSEVDLALKMVLRTRSIESIFVVLLNLV